MSGGPRVRSMNVTDPETRPVLGPAGNKARPVGPARKPAAKPLKKLEAAGAEAEAEAEADANGEKEKKNKKKVSSPVSGSASLSPTLNAPSVLRRHELLLRSNLSLNASCSSEASTDSFCSRASTGRIGRMGLMSRGRRQTVIPRPEKISAKLEKVVPDGDVAFPLELLQGKRRCAWVTANTDPCYAAFHDEEWGVPVHDDKKLFELLVLSGALAELTWPAILSRRHTFREVFMGFDPSQVSKLNEKKIVAPGSTASSLLSELKLRAIIENAWQIVKIVEEFGSFDNYCWSFVNHKPIVSRFRYPRQVPVKTPKADVISKDLVRRGFRSVGPTVIYSFMQAAGMTNDHLICCFRFEECAAAAVTLEGRNEGDAVKDNCKERVDITSDVVVGIDLELSRAVDELKVS